jgi:xanthine dehydrogenase accessory factor
MSLDLPPLRDAIRRHARVIRVLVAETRGSAPREAGTAMLVWTEGQSGTIGGGALEWEALREARALLADPSGPRRAAVPLGPALQQCCGGAVTLVFQPWDKATVDALTGPVLAMPLPGAAADMPLAVTRLIARARDRGEIPGTRIVEGWLVEPLSASRQPLWVWGAGHVGRAIVTLLAPLPDFAITWIDTARDRFPATPEGVTQRVAPCPETLVPEAAQDARHLILTYSHPLDLALCHALLTHGFASLGLIGSATKRARFRSRLAALGHAASAIDRIDCPIGDPALGKHPQAIAIGVAASLLSAPAARQTRKDHAS